MFTFSTILNRAKIFIFELLKFSTNPKNTCIRHDAVITVKWMYENPHENNTQNKYQSLFQQK